MKQQLAECQTERNAFQNQCIRYKRKLVTCQVDNSRLENLLKGRVNAGMTAYEKLCHEALAVLPGDMTALRKVIAQVFDEESNEWEEDTDVVIRVRADQLHSGDWTPEVLK